MDAQDLGRMAPYGAAHLTALALIVAASIAAVAIGRRTRGTPREHALTAGLGWTMLVLTVVWTAWGFLPATWDVEQSLPFHYSDALRVVTAIALIARSGWAIALSYFWGLTLNLQAILTPDLVYLTHPGLEYAAYWILYGIALVAPVLLVWGLGHRPTWRGYAVSFAATVLWALVAISVNSVTGANYGYLSRAPEGPSLLDALGPWPVYLLWEAVLVALVWALMTAPQTALARRRGEGPVGAGGLVTRAPLRPGRRPGR